MKIGILSDTHDRVARTSRAVAILVEAGCEALIHCGDLTGPAVVLECGGLPSYFVFGNNDYDHDALGRAIRSIKGVNLGRGGWVELGGRRIAVTHGDLVGEIRRVLASDPDYLLTGHSHRACDERRDSVRWINPGALHRATRWTVATLELGEDRLDFLEVADDP